MTEQIATSNTGGSKARKPEMYSLIPVEFLAEVARVYSYGAEKYSRDNWLSGYPWSWSYDALGRHLAAFWSGQEIDPESGRHHLAHAAFHLASLYTYSENSRYLEHDDRPESLVRDDDDRPQAEKPVIETPVIAQRQSGFRPGDRVWYMRGDTAWTGTLVREIPIGWEVRSTPGGVLHECTIESLSHAF